jgi:thiamine transport system permease protein
MERSSDSFPITLLKTLQSPFQFRIIKFTFYQAILSTGFTLIVGLPLAYIFATYSFRGKRIIETIVSLPFVLPTIVVATSFLLMIGPNGWLNNFLIYIFNLPAPPIDISQTFTAILIAHVFYNTSIITRIIGDHWKRIDKNLISSAYTLGANKWITFWKIVIPSLSPAIWSATLLVFLFNFTSFGVILILGGIKFSTIEVEIYYQTTGLFNLPIASALSLLQLFFTGGIVILYKSILNKLTTTQSNKIPIFKPLSKEKHSIRLIIYLLITSILLYYFLPIFGLFIKSITIKTGDKLYFSLLYYQALFKNLADTLFYISPLKAIQTSLINAFYTIVISLGIGLPTSWVKTKTNNRKITTVLETMLMLPLGTSAVTLGLGYIIAFNNPNIFIIGSPLIIPLAHSLIAFPFVVRTLIPAFESIEPNIKYVASTLGASTYQILKNIEFPIILRAIIISAIFSFTISLGEFGASTMISRPEFPTIPLMIFRYLSKPGGLNYGMAIAMSCILIIVSSIGMFIISKLNTKNYSIF